ncbi:Endonuclease/exonuclease/phosphatase [Mycena rebaudengoi]|nr:Endonuclease/exonuclease/phosphatase [Mycena rebaudengoi]
MEPSDIDTVSLPAVKNLRSKFEQLAQTGSKGPGLAPIFAPRPRATSSTFSNGDKAPSSPTLRPSSSSSELRLSRKPPPPPPSRSAAPSPTASPLLRPAPDAGPVSRASLGPRSSLSAPIIPQLEANGEETQSTPSVSSLRNMFGNTPLPSPSPTPSHTRLQHTPRASLSGLHLHSESDVTGIKRPPPPPPTISHSSEDLFSSPDPFTESDGDSESSVAPSLPPRASSFSHHQRNGSSQTSSESDLSVPRVPPPRPPPRRRSPPVSLSPATPPAPTPSAPPPPLPVRRPTLAPVEDVVVSPAPPRLPVRPITIPAPSDSDLSPSASTSTASASERKTFGSGRLPPPPTRTIALGQKLPPARRPPSPSSDEESGDEAPPPDLPDSSRSSRRPPHLSFRAGYVGPSEPKIPVPAHHGSVIVSGTRIVVATHQHVKIYDVAVSDVPVYSLDKREIGHSHGIKELRVTCMEYRPCGVPADRGNLLWLGTKDGHLLELDVRTGCATAAKPYAHLHPVVRIFRHGRSMVSLDDAGKTLLFAPDDADGGADVQLGFTPPRVARITEKQDFAQMVNGKLWTAQRAELHAQRVQTIRVFDLFVPGAPGRAVVPLEAVGAVTSASMLPTQPGVVYVGHEAGTVSLWTLDEGGWPQCTEVVRVSTSDVLCLEGVNNRLWAGGRSGMISAYDVSVKPWVVTNCWMAHPGLPVKLLAVDHYGIEKTGRLCVVSVGRDEQVKLWDGLLASDWVDQELMKREASFSTFRDLSVLIVTWNADSAKPDALTGDPANMNFLHEVLNSVECPDIITFGFQEVVDLESRKMVAKNVLLGRKDKQDVSVASITGLSGLSEKVTTAYRRWYEYLLLAVRLAMPAQVPYTVIHTESLVGLFTCVFVKNSERMSVKDNVITSLKRGMGGRYGNKGGIITRLVIEDSSICFINCHLAAGQHATRARNADIAAMLEERALLPPSENEPLAYVGGGDGQMILDHEIVFLNGDMNYRIDQRRDNIIAAVRANEYDGLLTHDQLLKEIKYNRGCRLRGFMEGPLTFPPTYKYDRHSTEYDSSEKARAPAWCDRVLWRTRLPNRVQQLHYKRYEVNVSDHRPVSAAFKFTVKSIRHEVRQKAKAEVQIQWATEQERLLSAARDFYVELALI